MRIDVFAERSRDPGRSQGENLLFLVGDEGERPACIQVRNDLPGDRRIPRSAYFLRLHKCLLGVGDFLISWSVVEEVLELLLHGRGNLVDVRRIGAYGHGERGDRVTGRRGERRGRAVGQSVLLANAIAQPRGQRAAAENVVADPERGVVGVVVLEGEREPGEIFRVGLVGRDDLFLRPVELSTTLWSIRLYGTFDSHPESISFTSRSSALGVKIADDTQLGVRAADLGFVDCLDLVECDVLGAIDRFLEGGHVAHVVV